MRLEHRWVLAIEAGLAMRVEEQAAQAGMPLRAYVEFLLTQAAADAVDVRASDAAGVDRDIQSFLAGLAALPLEGEPDPDGEEFCWENDAAWSTLQGLITGARALFGSPCDCGEALGPLPEDPTRCARCGQLIPPAKAVRP